MELEKVASRPSTDLECKHYGVSSPTPLRNGSTVSLVHVDPALERRVWLKLDLWLLPVVTMFYFLSFLVPDLIAGCCLIDQLTSIPSPAGSNQPRERQGRRPPERSASDELSVQRRVDRDLCAVYRRRAPVESPS